MASLTADENELSVLVFLGKQSFGLFTNFVPLNHKDPTFCQAFHSTLETDLVATRQKLAFWEPMLNTEWRYTQLNNKQTKS